MTDILQVPPLFTGDFTPEQRRVLNDLFLRISQGVGGAAGGVPVATDVPADAFTLTLTASRLVGPNWNTTWYITAISGSSVSLEFSVPAPVGAQFWAVP